MLRYIHLAAAATLVAVCGAPVAKANCSDFAADGVNYNCSMTFNGVTRTWVQTIPVGYVAGNAMVIGLHGAPGDGAAFDGRSDLDKISNNGVAGRLNAPKFITLYPNGYLTGSGDLIWEINDLSQTSSSQSTCSPNNCPDDNGFIRALIQLYLSGAGVSPNKVYVTGHSAGAQFAMQLAVTSGDLIAAVANNEGLFPYSPPYPPTPNIENYGPPVAPVSVLTWKGQFGLFQFCGQYGSQSVFSVDQYFSYFVGHNHCKVSTPQLFCATPPSTGTSTQGSLPVRHASQCDNGVSVDSYQVFCGQHQWYNTDINSYPCVFPPPYPGTVNDNNTGAFGVPANSLVTEGEFVWDYFAAHPKGTIVPPPPITVTITAPKTNVTLSKTDAITVTSVGFPGAFTVRFSVDGANVGAVGTTSPYTINLDTTAYVDGSHIITAFATDTAIPPNTGTYSINVTINNHGGPVTRSVLDFGAVCDGVNDDRPFVLAALNGSRPLDTVTIPAATCLLNSFSGTSSPNKFFNIAIPSGVELQGVTAGVSKLLQGPNGQQTVAGNGGKPVENSVVVVGNDYASVHYSTRAPANYEKLNPITIGDATVTLVTPSDNQFFAVGAYVVMYDSFSTCTDVCIGQVTQITGITGGTLTLLDTVLRSMAGPIISNVTSLTSHDVTIDSLIIQGALPLSIMESFNVTLTNNHFITDPNAPGVNGYQWSTVGHMTLTNNILGDVVAGGNPVFWQMTQRNSQNETWTGNTLYDPTGFGDYGGNVTITGNHIYLHPNSSNNLGVALGGMNVLFSGNDVHTLGNNTGSAPFGAAIYGMSPTANPSYAAYVGGLQLLNNTIYYQGDGNQCILLNGGTGSIVRKNTCNIQGSGQFLYSATLGNIIYQNTVQPQSGQIWTGNGILLKAGTVDDGTIAGNSLIHTGTSATGIIADNTGCPPAHTGPGYKIYNNAFSGFTTNISLSPTCHPTSSLVAPPISVTITAPPNMSTVSGVVTLTAATSGNIDVVNDQFYIDGAANGNQIQGSTPFSMMLNTATLTNGSHAIKSIAKDSAANSGTSPTITVTVSNAVIPKGSTASGHNTGGTRK